MGTHMWESDAGTPAWRRRMQDRVDAQTASVRQMNAFVRAREKGDLAEMERIAATMPIRLANHSRPVGRAQ